LRILIDPEAQLPTSNKFPSVRFDAIATLEYGRALSAQKRIRGDYPVMGSNGIDGYHNSFLVDGPGIVVGRKGSAGKIVFSEKNFWPIDTTYWLKFDHSRLLPIFAYWLLKWLDLPILVGKKGIGVPGLNRNDVHKSLIPDVPIKDQRKIVAEIDKVNNQLIDAEDRKAKILEKYL
jgi:restriction endonuclease S subunit